MPPNGRIKPVVAKAAKEPCHYCYLELKQVGSARDGLSYNDRFDCGGMVPLPQIRTGSD